MNDRHRRPAAISQPAGASRRWPILSLAFIAWIGFASPTKADESASAPAVSDILHHVSFGYLAHDVLGLWSGFRIERAATAENVDIVFAPHLDLLGGSIRPALGGTIANGDGTSFGYADARYEIDGPFGTFFGLGLGLAIHDGALSPQVPSGGHRDKALGSRGLFHVPIEIGVTFADTLRVSAYFEHVSNGWLGTDVNEGMDNLGMRIGYKF
jgi:lipid A 3-O-deacylase